MWLRLYTIVLSLEGRHEVLVKMEKAGTARSGAADWRFRDRESRRQELAAIREQLERARACAQVLEERVRVRA